jgi:hypothetical protein
MQKLLAGRDAAQSSSRNASGESAREERVYENRAHCVTDTRPRSGLKMQLKSLLKKPLNPFPLENMRPSKLSLALIKFDLLT